MGVSVVMFRTVLCLHTLAATFRNVAERPDTSAPAAEPPARGVCDVSHCAPIMCMLWRRSHRGRRRRRDRACMWSRLPGVANALHTCPVQKRLNAFRFTSTLEISLNKFRFLHSLEQKHCKTSHTAPITLSRATPGHCSHVCAQRCSLNSHTVNAS